jgi:PAS domain S-box-containing protein
MDFSVDYEHGISTMIMGSFVYIAIAYIVGSYAEKVRNLVKELQQKIALQDSLINTIPMPLYFKDLNFNYVGFNPAFLEIIDKKEQGIVGKNVSELFDPSVAEICNQMDVDLISEQKKQVKEVNITTSNGRIMSVISSKALILDNEGRPSGIVGVLLDITEQKESQKLKINLAQLMQEEKLKTEFFSNISHELRTPLNVIYSAEQIIEMSMNNISDISNQIKIRKNTLGIKQNCLRLLRLVNNLIDITKIDSKAFDLRIQNLDIVYVVEEITLSVADFISNKGVHLVFDTDVEEKVMAFDEEKMERIILNLLSNAIKYTPDGGTISVNILDRVNSIIIEIKDSGVGIPNDKLDEVFNRFYQISPLHTRSQEGSGIGLNLVKSLVEMHHGEISVNSVLGSGTTFIINLPCVIQEDDIIQNQIVIDQQSRIEKIQLEFSDIYKISNRG